MQPVRANSANSCTLDRRVPFPTPDLANPMDRLAGKAGGRRDTAHPRVLTERPGVGVVLRPREAGLASLVGAFPHDLCIAPALPLRCSIPRKLGHDAKDVVHQRAATEGGKVSDLRFKADFLLQPRAASVSQSAWRSPRRNVLIRSRARASACSEPRDLCFGTSRDVW